MLSGVEALRHIIQNFEVEDTLSLAFNVTDLTALDIRGDSQLRTFITSWNGICDNLLPGQINDSGLASILAQKLEKFPILSHDLTLYSRLPSEQRTTKFLTRAVTEVLNKETKKANRKALVDANNSAAPAAPAAKNPPALPAAKTKVPADKKPKAPAERPKLPCHDFAAGKCTRGAQCRYAHDSSATKTKMPPADRNKSSEPCRNFAAGKCTRGAQCIYMHDAISAVAKQAPPKRLAAVLVGAALASAAVTPTTAMTTPASASFPSASPASASLPSTSNYCFGTILRSFYVTDHRRSHDLARLRLRLRPPLHLRPASW